MEPLKSILVVYQHALEEVAKLAFPDFWFKVTM